MSTTLTEDILGSEFDDLTIDRMPIETDKSGKKYYDIKLHYSGDSLTRCPHCGFPLRRHGTKSVKAIDVPLFSKPVVMEITVPRYRCQNIENRHVVGQEIHEVLESRHVTKRAYVSIGQRSLRETFEDIADDYMASDTTILRLSADFIAEHRNLVQFETPHIVGIGLLSYGSRVGDITVIADLEHRVLFDILQGTDLKMIIDYFHSLPNADTIEWIFPDDSFHYVSDLCNALPNAHYALKDSEIPQRAASALYAIRDQLYNAADDDHKATIRSFDDVLPKHAYELTLREEHRLNVSERLSTLMPIVQAWHIKEGICTAFQSDKETAEAQYLQWKEQIPESDLYKPFRDLASFIDSNYMAAINSFDCPINDSDNFLHQAQAIIDRSNVSTRRYSFEVMRARALYKLINFDSIEEHPFGPSL